MRSSAEFPNNSTVSLEYFLLSITVAFVVADGPLTPINQTYSVDIRSSLLCVLLGSVVTK